MIQSQDQDSRIKEIAGDDAELAQGIAATLQVAAEAGIDLLVTLKNLAFPTEQLKTIYTDSARIPRIFLTALIWREVRQNRIEKNSSK